MGLVVLVIQSLNPVQPFETPWAAGSQASLTFTISPSLVKFMSMESVAPSNRLILRCPLLLPPSIFPSIRVFSAELALRTRWLKYWSFGFSIRPSNGYSELISFRMDWFDLYVVQETLKSLRFYRKRKRQEATLSLSLPSLPLLPSVSTR